MRLPILLATLVLLPLLAAPTASAHIEGFSQARTLTIGPYLVYLQPQPDVVFANTTLSMTLQIASNATGATARGVAATLLVGGPEEFNKRIDLREDRQGNQLIGAVLLPHRGNYSIGILLKDANDTYRGTTDIEAYPDYPFRIRSADANQDVHINTPTTIRFEVVNRTTLRPSDPFPDLKLRVEHWSDDHTVLRDSADLPLQKDGEGYWKVTHSFPNVGMYHLKFASQAAGFTYTDVPILHLYATQPPNADVPADGLTNTVPAAGLGILVLGIAALALARRRA